MKTAISLPDELFILADEFAHTLGISRSELYASAIREYITNHTKANLLERMNEFCDQVDTTLPKDIVNVTRRKLLEVEFRSSIQRNSLPLTRLG